MAIDRIEERAEREKSKHWEIALAVPAYSKNI